MDSLVLDIQSDVIIRAYFTQGCIDSLAFNYDSSASVSDSSCCYNSGCMDILASNYDSSACFNDSSCIYIAVCNEP